MEKNSHNRPAGIKANALLCPNCCVEYVKVRFDFEFVGAILHNVEALRCPTCKEELFTTEQLNAITAQISKPPPERHATEK
ncbi:MAG: hypothetical protein NWE98_07210 [Candidatus Bathyarchaeota archaeon]|nr:hypothetical protein [Candidatus Bathyarchaeota archaeon]